MSVDDNEFLIPIEESRRARPASVEQKALGNRLARLVGSRLTDKPSIGGRNRRGGMDIDAPTGGVRGYRKPTLSNFDPDNDGWVDEGSTHPRFIGIDSPTRGTETARRMASAANEDYRGQHGAPGKGAGAPLHDMLDEGGVYPEDVYSADAIRFYGVGDDQLDPIAASLIRQYKGKPNAEVTIYRAVPLSRDKRVEKLEKQLARYMARGKLPEGTSRNVEPSDWSQGVRDEIERLKNLPPDDIKITPGDWVTPIREYAVMHGDGALNGEYEIIKKRVKAKDIYTAGDSWLEWGYDPEVTKKLSGPDKIVDQFEEQMGSRLSSAAEIDNADTPGDNAIKLQKVGPYRMRKHGKGHWESEDGFHFRQSSPPYNLWDVYENEDPYSNTVYESDTRNLQQAVAQFRNSQTPRLSSGSKKNPINIKLDGDYGDISGKKDFTPEELKTIDEINERLSSSGMDFAWISLENEDGTKTSSPLINFSGRPIVIARIDDETNVPFYRSTGLGGKDQDLYPAGKWYPFWGYSNSARFFVKNEGMQDYYGIPELKEMSQKLDEITKGLPAKLVGKEWRSVRSLEDGSMNDDFRNLINNTSFVNADRISSDRDVRHHIDVSKKKLREAIRSKRNKNTENARTEKLSSGKAPRYPREPTLGAFLGEADSYFGDSNSWEEFKKKYNDAEVVFLDYETTGLDFDEFGKATTNGKPTQIGLVRMKGGKEIGRLNLFMNPEEPLGEWSLANLKDADGNHITNEWLATQMPMAEAHRQVAEFIGPNAIIGVQNATFDKNVLDDALAESGIEWRPRGYLDTREISSLTLPVWSEDSPDGPHIVSSRDGTTKPSSSLAAITEYLGVELGDGHHNADADAFATSQVMQKIIDGAIEKNWDTSALSKKRRDEKLRLEREKFDADVAKFESEKNSFVAARDAETTSLSSGVEPIRFTLANRGMYDDSFDQTKEFADPDEDKYKFQELYEIYKYRVGKLEASDNGFGKINREATARAAEEVFGPGIDSWEKALEILEVRRKRFNEDESYKEELRQEHIKRYGYLYSPIFKNGEKTQKSTLEIYDDELAYNSLKELIQKIGKGKNGQTKASNKVNKVLEDLTELNKNKNRKFVLSRESYKYVLEEFDPELERLKTEEFARLRRQYESEGIPYLDAIKRASKETNEDERFKPKKLSSGEERPSIQFRPDSPKRPIIQIAPNERELLKEHRAKDYKYGDKSVLGGEIRKTTNTWLRGLSSEQMAKVLVPSNRDEHFQMWLDDYAGADVVDPATRLKFQKYYDDFHQKNPWDTPDFSPDNVKAMQELLAQSIEDNPQMKWAFENHGAPSFSFMDPRGIAAYEAIPEVREKFAAIAKQRNDGKPVRARGRMSPNMDTVYLNKEVFLEALDDSIPSATKSTLRWNGQSPVKGQKSIENSLAGTLLHEWGHWLHFKAIADSEGGPKTTIHTRSRYGSRDKNNQAYARALAVASQFNKFEYDQNRITMFENDVPFSETPDVPRLLTSYGNVNMAETMAEGIVAVLHPDNKIQDEMISPSLKKAATTLLGGSDTYQPWRDGDRTGRILSSGRSAAVRDERRGRLEDALSEIEGLRRSRITETSIPQSKDTQWKKTQIAKFVPVPKTRKPYSSTKPADEKDVLQMFIDDAVSIPGTYDIDSSLAAPKIKREISKKIAESMDFTPQDFVKMFQTSMPGSGVGFADDENFRDVSLILNRTLEGVRDGSKFFYNPKKGSVASGIDFSVEQRVLKVWNESFIPKLESLTADELFDKSNMWNIYEKTMDDYSSGSIGPTEMRRWSGDHITAIKTQLYYFDMWGNKETRQRREGNPENDYLGIYRLKDGTLMSIDSYSLSNTPDAWEKILFMGHGIKKGIDYKDISELMVAKIDKNTPDDAKDLKILKELTIQNIKKVIPSPEELLKSRGLVEFDANTPEGQGVLKQALISGLVHTWAISANDSNDVALSMQNVARELFSVDGAVGWDRGTEYRMDRVVASPGPGQIMEDFDGAPVLSEMQRKFVGEFLQTSHEATQQYFKDRGITHLAVYRGITAGENAFGEPIAIGDMDIREVRMRPLSSWSINEATARSFSRRPGNDQSGYVIKAFVPIEDIFSTPFTGFGCLEEDEAVILGRPMQAMVYRVDEATRYGKDGDSLATKLVDIDRDSMIKQIEAKKLSSGETDVLERPTPYKADTRFNTSYEKGQLDEQSSYMRRFAQATEHYQKTGDWLGKDFDVVIAVSKYPSEPTVHSSEAEAKNLLKSEIISRAEDAFAAKMESWTKYPGTEKEPEHDSFIKNWIKKFESDMDNKSKILKEEVALLQYKHDAKKTRIEQNVLDLEDLTPEEYDDLLKQSEEIQALKQNNTDEYWKLFGNDETSEEKFLMHQGSSELDGGILNPERTIGSDTLNAGSADTKSLNNINVADIKAKDAQIDRQIDGLQKLIDSAVIDGTITIGNSNRQALGMVAGSLAQNIRQNTPDEKIDLAARGWSVAHFIEQSKLSISRLQNEQKDIQSVIKALSEGGNQFLSAKMAGDSLESGYFGRYSHRIVPVHIAEHLNRNFDFDNLNKQTVIHDQYMTDRWQTAMRGTEWLIAGELHKHWTNKLGPGYEKQIIGKQRPFVGFSARNASREESGRLFAITPALTARSIAQYKNGKKVDLSTLVKPRSIPEAEALQPDELSQELRMSSGKKKVVESIMNANYYGIVSARHIEHTSNDGNKTNYWVVLDSGGHVTAYDAESVNEARRKFSETWTEQGMNPITGKRGPVPLEEVNILDAIKKTDNANKAIGRMSTWDAGSMKPENSPREILGTMVARTRRRTGIASEMMRLHRDTWPEQNLQHSDSLSSDGRAFAASATPEVLDGQRESVGANAGNKLSSGLTEYVTNEYAKALVSAYPRSLKEPTADIAVARKEGRPVSWLLDETIDPKIGAVIGELIDGVLDDPRFKKAFDGEDINPFLLETSKGPWARIGEKSPFSERIGPAIDKITGIVLSRDTKMMDWDAETVAKGLVLRAGIHITRAKYLENERRKMTMSPDLVVQDSIKELVGEYDKYAKELIGMGGDYFQPGPMDHNRVVIAIDKQAIDGLIKNKRLLSQFETGRSNGHYNPQARQQAEVTLFGYPPDMAPEFRPIYGMAAYGGVTEEVASAGQQYGNYLLVLKPGTEDRTTVTESDSLSLMGTTSAMNSPDINMMMLRNAGDRDTFDYPVEAQVHPSKGGISLDDIAYIIVRDDYTGENPDEEEKLQALSKRLGIPAVSEYDMDYGGTQGAFDEDYILNAEEVQTGDMLSSEPTRLSSGRSNRRLRKGRPGAKPRSDAEYVAYSANELSIRAVPASPEELASVLRSSPHTKNSNKSIRKINKLIEELEINWDKQKELQKKVELTLNNSPSLRNMLGRFDIPPMLLTDFGLKQGFIFESNLEPTNWYAGGGVYTPSYGFIAFPDKVLKDYIPGTNFTGEYVIRHELGHAIHAMAKKTNKAAFKRESEDLDGIYKELKAATSWAKDELKAGRSSSEIQDELSSMVNMLSEYDSSLAKQISDYAATNRAEYIAEAIAYATAPANEGLRRLKAEHYDMLAEFLGLTVEELKMMGL